jgi:hypothetical protein
VRVEEHQHKVLELAVHGDGLVLLRRAAHIDAVLRLTLGDDAWGGLGITFFYIEIKSISTHM